MAMHLQNFFRQTQGRDGTSHFVVTLSAPAFALAVAVVAVTLGWCFFMGFMVGRGQNPEKHLEEIAGMLQPAGQQAQAPAAKPEDAAQGQDGAAGQGGQDGPGGQDAGAQGAEAGQDATGQDGQNVEEAGQAQRSQAQKPQAPAVPAQAPLKDAIKPKPQAKAEPAVPTFTYTYRLATVKSQEAAKSEQKRYARKGFSCVIRNLGTGFSLNLTVTGTEKDDQALRQKLKSAGLGAPMLLSKKKR